jgi:hypothetical protein
MNDAEQPPALPVKTPPATPARCPHCGGGSIAPNLRLTLTAETGSVGPSYKTGFLVRGTEPLFADLCQNCGTVVRLYVKTPTHNWVR